MSWIKWTQTTLCMGPMLPHQVCIKILPLHIHWEENLFSWGDLQTHSLWGYDEGQDGWRRTHHTYPTPAPQEKRWKRGGGMYCIIHEEVSVVHVPLSLASWQMRIQQWLSLLESTHQHRSLLSHEHCTSHSADYTPTIRTEWEWRNKAWEYGISFLLSDTSKR